MPLTVGQNLQNRYQIEAMLGQGGMGAVYRATDSRLNIVVAIKENLDASPAAQTQFNREAQIAARLSHPDLPRVTDYFFIQGQGQYLVMDYVEGEDLESMVSRLGTIPESYALPWIIQVCDALDYLHQQSPPVIHRDIKPANIKIRPNGKAVLVDFGIAKIYDPNLATTLGAKAVTPGYSPVEQYGGKPTDARSDIYALGATLYRLLTGKPLPESVQFVTGEIRLVPPRQLNPAISLSTEQTILKAIEMASSRRFQTAREFKAALTGQAAVQIVPPTQKMDLAAANQTVVANPSTAGPQQYPPAQSIQPPVYSQPQYQQPYSQAPAYQQPAYQQPGQQPPNYQQPYSQPPNYQQSYPQQPAVQKAARPKNMLVLGLVGVAFVIIACLGLLYVAGKIGLDKNANATNTASAKTEVAVQRTQDSRSLASTQEALQILNTQQAQADQATQQALQAQNTQTALQSTRQAPGYIPLIQGWLTDLQFYEGGKNVVPAAQRVYSTSFNNNSTQYIWWEISMDREQAGQQVQFTINWIYYYPDGSVFAQTSSDFTFDPTWAGIITTAGWGYDTVNNWTPGTYRAEFYINNQKIGEGSFTIQ